MGLAPLPRERYVTIIARDPALRVGKRIVRAQVAIPSEALAPGPVGYRVEVIDYDASNDMLYLPRPLPPGDGDPFESYTDKQLLGDPLFHRHNAYALVMRTLARFEFALGRRVSWGFGSHQLKVAPHAFADANAFYSQADDALLFGYFPGKGGTWSTPACRTTSWCTRPRTPSSTVCASATPTRPPRTRRPFTRGSPTSSPCCRSSPCPPSSRSMLPGRGRNVDVRALTPRRAPRPRCSSASRTRSATRSARSGASPSAARSSSSPAPPTSTSRSTRSRTAAARSWWPRC